MSGFTKLFSSITTSSLWCQDHIVLRVWIAMLAECDSNGMVEGSIPGFAHLCMISPDELARVIGILSGPDEYSRTKDHEGRRILTVDGGWQILNYKSYRERCQAKEGSRAPYMRERRGAKCNTLQPDVTRNTEAEAEYRVQRKEKEVPLQPSASAAPSSAKKERKPRKVITTHLKAPSVEAFQAAWETPPKSFRKWDKEAREYVDKPVAKGSRLEAERNFQAIVDSGASSPADLYYAFFGYTSEGDGPREGFFQALSTFYGPEKATWLQWLDRGRELAREAS